MKTPKVLEGALRQYQHNDCSGLVKGFDYKETIKAFRALRAENTDLRAQVKDLKNALSGLDNFVEAFRKEILAWCEEGADNE